MRTRGPGLWRWWDLWGGWGQRGVNESGVVHLLLCTAPLSLNSGEGERLAWGEPMELDGPEVRLGLVVRVARAGGGRITRPVRYPARRGAARGHCRGGERWGLRWGCRGGGR